MPRNRVEFRSKRDERKGCEGFGGSPNRLVGNTVVVELVGRRRVVTSVTYPLAPDARRDLSLKFKLLLPLHELMDDTDDSGFPPTISPTAC
jgi:hypothetical protein